MINAYPANMATLVTWNWGGASISNMATLVTCDVESAPDMNGIQPQGHKYPLNEEESRSLPSYPVNTPPPKGTAQHNVEEGLATTDSIRWILTNWILQRRVTSQHNVEGGYYTLKRCKRFLKQMLSQGSTNNFILKCKSDPYPESDETLIWVKILGNTLWSLVVCWSSCCVASESFCEAFRGDQSLHPQNKIKIACNQNL